MNTNTETSLFFNDVDNDRIYYAEDFAEFFIPFFTNGIFNNGCQVKADKNNMSVDVSVGRGFINGYRYYNKIAKNLIIDNANGVLNRIDNIVIRLDLTNRTITAQVIKGTFEDVPKAPDLVRTSAIYDLRIAKISIPAGTTEITQDLVTDTRFITSDCGNVISPIETPDTEQLFIQIQAQFEKELKKSQLIVNNLKTDSDEILKTTQETINSQIEKNDQNFTKKLTDYELKFSSWFQKVKDTLSTDVAGALLNSIEAVDERVNEVESKIGSIYTPKGSVDTYDDLEAKKSDAEVGDVWDTKDTGMNYAWTGEKWDELGMNIDLSDYVTTEKMNKELLKKADSSTIQKLIKAETDEDAKAKSIEDPQNVYYCVEEEV